MKRLLAVSAITALLVMGIPGPAQAAPCVSLDLTLLGLEVDCDLIDSTGRVVGTVTDGVVDIVDSVVPTVTVPGPVVTVTAPRPAPVTRTVTPPTRTATATATATRTAAPVTVSAAPTTETVTATATQTNAPAPVSEPSATLAAPPAPVQTGGIDFILPKSPTKAAATGSLLGLFVGILIGVVALYFVYRRGQKDGEKATLQEFLGELRSGTVRSPKHRA